MFAKDLSNKIFSPPRHQGTKSNFNKHLLFVSWCLCGYSFRFIRVGCLIKVIFCTEICASMHCLLGSFITPPQQGIQSPFSACVTIPIQCTGFLSRWFNPTRFLHCHSVLLPTAKGGTWYENDNQSDQKFFASPLRFSHKSPLSVKSAIPAN
jgi:hypothetical protein